MHTYLDLNRVSIAYQQTPIIHDFSLSLAQGQLGCLLGPSGCGKTTLLRAIAGFEPLTHGQIKLENRVLSAPHYTQVPEQRQIGVVFQDYALFPHLTVAQNIAFGIRQQSKAQQYTRVQALLDLVSLPDFGKRYPHELSGGQQQRIALARALAPKPRLLLLDEPFASQDISLRESLAQEVRAILKQTQTTALLVTHDQHEAFAMADKIAVMQAGRLQQWASAQVLYEQPSNRFVADFIGQGSLLKAELVDDSQIKTALGTVSHPQAIQFKRGESMHLLIRPQQVQVTSTGDYQAGVVSCVFRGENYLLRLQLPNTESIHAYAAQPVLQNTPVQFQLALHKGLLLK
jgi:iron(III) transport system ATP-binding protein